MSERPASADPPGHNTVSSDRLNWPRAAVVEPDGATRPSRKQPPGSRRDAVRCQSVYVIGGAIQLGSARLAADGYQTQGPLRVEAGRLGVGVETLPMPAALVRLGDVTVGRSPGDGGPGDWFSETHAAAWCCGTRPRDASGKACADTPTAFRGWASRPMAAS